jgi:hypothetical protein
MTVLVLGLVSLRQVWTVSRFRTPAARINVSPGLAWLTTETVLQREAQQGAASVLGACLDVIGVSLRSAVATD